MNNNHLHIDTLAMTRIELLNSAGLEYTDELVSLFSKATTFLKSKPWCSEILEGWLSRGWGYIIGVFYFHIVPSSAELPDYLWVIVGDLPSAYLDVEYCPDVTAVIEGYIGEMQEWVDRVMSDRPLDESVIPVNVPPDKIWAGRLQSRLDILRDSVLSECRNEVNT